VGPELSPGCESPECFESLNGAAVKAQAEVAAKFVRSDGSPAPAPTSVVDMGLAARSLRPAPGERTAALFLRALAVAKIGAGTDPLAGEDAQPQRDFLVRKARRTVPIGCALMLVLARTASIVSGV
jgi:hypothetical protein